MTTPKLDTKKSLRRLQFLGYASVFAMFGIGGAWSLMAGLNGAVIASATLVVESYSKKVQHRDGGIVGDIMIRDGDRVTEGQDLVRLDNTDTKAELAIITGLLDEALIKRGRLEAQRDGLKVMILPAAINARTSDVDLANVIIGQKRLLESRIASLQGKKEQLVQQIDQLNEQIGGIDSQLDSKKTQLVLIKQEAVGLKKLQKQGLVPLSRILAMDRETARLDGELGELVASRAATLARVGEIKLQSIQIEEDGRSETLAELRDVEGKIAEYKERAVAAASRLERTTIKAPITGTVYQLALHTVGGVMAPGETVMLIVPEGDDLVLQAQVMPNDIDQVQTGQGATIRFPGFNARLTPEVQAKVTQVAADTSRVDANTPPFYAVRLEISAEEIAKLGTNQLKPGMSAEAFIQTETRTPFSYLMKPLMDQFAHALRES
jgi:HlyD family secretion protein